MTLRPAATLVCTPPSYLASIHPLYCAACSTSGQRSLTPNSCGRCILLLLVLLLMAVLLLPRPERTQAQKQMVAALCKAQRAPSVCPSCETACLAHAYGYVQRSREAHS